MYYFQYCPMEPVLLPFESYIVYQLSLLYFTSTSRKYSYYMCLNANTSHVKITKNKANLNTTLLKLLITLTYVQGHVFFQQGHYHLDVDMLLLASEICWVN